MERGDIVVGAGVDEPVTDEVAAALHKLPTATSLVFNNHKISPPHLRTVLDRPRVEWLDLNYTGVGDEIAPCLRVSSVASLRGLFLAETNITGACLSPLRSMRELEQLDLRGDNISDESLHHLSGLTNLKRLVLAQTPISGAGLTHLAALASLEHLDLSDCPIADAGLAQLRGLPALRDLNLSGSIVSDAGLVHLGAIRSLVDLNLSATRVAGEGLPHLRSLTHLRTLYLSDCPITDSAMQVLSEMFFTNKQLYSIQIDGTNVTAAGAAWLKSRLPADCVPPRRVIWFPKSNESGN